MIVWRFSMQAIVEYTKWEVSYLYSLSHKREIFLRIPTTSVMCLHLSIQEEDIIEHTNAKCHMCTLLVNS